MKQISRLATGVGMMLCLGLSAGVASAVNPPHSPDDHFLCYRMSPGHFGPLTTNLVDQFETGDFSVTSLGEVCAPANKNAEGVVDPVTHLVAYNVIPVNVTATPGAPPRSGIRIVNQLMDFNVDIARTDRLLVPSNKSLTGVPPPPDLGAINVDHYKCYRAKASPGQPRMRATVHLVTQFDDKDYRVKRPTRLCSPVDKNGEGIKNAFGHMMCYKAAPVSGPRHTPTHIFVNSQLGPSERDTIREFEFCVPSLKNPAPAVCGDDFQEFGEGCDGTDSPACPGQCITQFNGQDVCDCPGPHPFAIGTGSILNGRGALGNDMDAPPIPLSGTLQIVNSVETPPGSGIFPLAVPPATLPPGSALGMNICTYLVDNGSGFAGQGLINCFGVPIPSPPSQDYTLYKDHCTGCESCDSGQRPGVCNCATSADCSGGQICSSGFCFTGCFAGAGCGAGQVCTSPSGAGVCVCTSNTGCPAGETCSSGACIKTCVTTANCTAPAPTFTCTVTANSCPGGNATASLGCSGTPFDVLHNTISNGGHGGTEPAVCVSALPIDPPPCDNVFPPGCSGPSCISKASAETGACGACSGGSCSFTTGTCTLDTDCTTPDVCLGHCSVSTLTPCHDDTDCPGAETCGSPTPHNGVCNSPNDFVPGKQGAAPGWLPENAFIQINMAIKVQTAPCSAHARTCKASPTTDCDTNADCGGGDFCLTGAQPFPFTTGRAASGIMDWDAMQDVVQGLAHDGIPFSCVSLLNSVTSGAELVMSAPALDQTNVGNTNDISVGINMNAQ